MCNWNSILNLVSIQYQFKEAKEDQKRPKKAKKEQRGPKLSKDGL